MKKMLLLTITVVAIYNALPAHATTYFDTRALFASPSAPTQDLAAVNVQGAFDYIRVGTLSQSISATDLYVIFSVPASNSCARLNGFGGGSFPVNFFFQPFTDASLQTPLTGNSVDARFGIRALPDGTCVTKFDNITLPSSSYIVLAFGLLPQFLDRLNPWPLTVTAGGTWESVPPFCSGGTGIKNCAAYSGTPYILITDVNPFPASPPQGTTYLDTRSLFVAASTPAQDLNLVNPTDGGVTQDSSITLGTISADIPGQSDYYLNFSAPFPNACATIETNLQPSGTSFFNIAYFTSDGAYFLGHDDVADNDINTLPNSTCVAHFRAINVRNAGTLSVLQVRHFSSGYLIPSFPLVMTSDGTWTGPLTPYCGLHCRHYDGTLYAQLSDNPLTTPSAMPTLLSQLKSDSVTAISAGATTTQSTIVFRGTPQSSSANLLQLQIELATSTANFTGIPSAVSNLIHAGSTTTVTMSGLADGTYFWRARVVDTVTNSASNWQMFGTGATPDFTVHQVPLYTQVESNFPSNAQTRVWSSETYANGRGNVPPGACGLNISGCGCAITSIIMLGRYYGINFGIDEQDFTPDHINAWLEATPTGTSMVGYDSHGNVVWSQAAAYAQDASSGTGLHFDGMTTDQAPSTLNQYLSLRKPVILHHRPVGHYFVADDQLATTYSIKDPDFYLTKTLNDNVANTLTTHYYQNTYTNLRLFSPVAAHTASQGMYISLGSPAELLITDPNGNQLGVTPTTGTIYNGIDGAGYASDGISDGGQMNPNRPAESKVAWIPNPVSGSYNVQVVGTDSGAYTLQTLSYDANGSAHSQTVTGNTAPNVTTGYLLNFTPQQPENIAMTPIDTTPPTISHTILASQYLLNATSIQFFFNATDTGVGVFSVTSTLDGIPLSSGTTLNFTQTGNRTITVTAADFVGNTASKTMTYSVRYLFGGFQPPIRTGGSGIYKLGRMLPIKFQLTDANGAFVSTATAQLVVTSVRNGIMGTNPIDLAISTNDTGNLFRYDATVNQYIYNFDTTPLTAGMWEIKAALDDGTSYAVLISLQ
jgi:hypothetical protein